MSWQALRFQKNRQNRHHLTPRCRRGRDTPDNLLRIDVEKHECWHKLFGVATLEEVIILLERLRRAKKRAA